MYFCFLLFASHSFMPLFLKFYEDNYIDAPSDPGIAVCMILLIALQLVVIHLQQRWGARWFVPRRYRIDPQAFDYYRSVPESVLERAKTATDPFEPSNFVDDITCSICMNYIHYKVDEDGGLIRKDDRQLDILKLN